MMDAKKEDCEYFDQDENEPCWGEVEVIDEVLSEDDYRYIYACQGHRDKWFDGEYMLEPDKKEGT